MARIVRGTLVLLVVGGLFCSRVAAQEVVSDLWDEPDPGTAEVETANAAEKAGVLGAAASTRPGMPPQNLPPLRIKDLKKEMVALVCIAFYVINIFVGRRRNDKAALAWATAFCNPGCLLDRNFALLGPGDDRAKEVLLKESATEYKLPASGRRYVQSMMVRLDMKCRQDAFAMLWYLFSPRDDRISIEVYMQEGCMPDTVLAVAPPKQMKAMLRDEGGEDDVKSMTHRIEVTKDRLPEWPSDKLAVHGEHSTIFYDLVTEQLYNQVFSRAAFEKQGKLFRELHFTSQNSYGPPSQKRVLRFSFNLPDRENMADLGVLMGAAMTFVDVVGTYKLSPELKRRAEKLREEAAKSKLKNDRDRQDVLEERKAAKRKEEQEYLRTLPPDKREKALKRREELEKKRYQRKFAKRM